MFRFLYTKILKINSNLGNCMFIHVFYVYNRSIHWEHGKSQRYLWYARILGCSIG